jgi:hypothetical protein
MTRTKYTIESIDYVVRQISVIKNIDSKNILEILMNNFLSLIGAL